MSKPIRVLQIVGTMNRGGAETLVMELYRHIDRNLVQFDFLIYGQNDDRQGVFNNEIRALGGRIFNAKKRLYREPISYEKEISSFAHNHPEYRIVHSHLNMRGGYILNRFKREDASIKTIAHSHTAFPHKDLKNKLINHFGKKLLQEYTDYYFACSSKAMLAICGKQPDNKSRFILHNAIDVEKFAFSQHSRNRIRAELGISEDSFVVIHVGRFTEEKNHKFVLETFRIIAEKRPESKLILVGQGELLPEMMLYSKKLGISEKVIFTGVRGDVNEILSASDVFLLPSKGEGFGIVLVEAQANWLPCIISKDVIPDEADVHAGLVVHLGLDESPKVWAEACLQAPMRLENNKAQIAVRDAGYDINDVAAFLQKFYLSIWRE